MDHTGNENGDPHCSKCDSERLKALYHLNILAKKYAESAEESYNRGLKEGARVDSQRKKALYSLKQSILAEFVDSGCVDEIRTHEIDGRVYYCFYVGDFSYHSPVSEWDEPLEEAPESAVQLESFDANPSNRSERVAEREVLEQLTEWFESPNYHIESPFTDSGFGGRFVGWSGLPGTLQEGDRVPDRYLDDHHNDRDYLFEVGDSFQTSEGECEIIDRYYAYLTPLYDRSPLYQQQAYDVLLDGDRREGIRQREIVDGWNILAESIADPVPNVDGPLSGMVRGAIEDNVDEPIEFEIGDILEIEMTGVDDPPMYCRLTEVHVSSHLLIGQYEAVPPSDDTPQGLTIEEIADDVVAVHDEPPTEV
ncbi:hypothetical protein [Halorubrum sp. AJ67]|uniref:hypothetical protein n=1 Tax=Halorubrum sp. AJ67 TaxID=1173487 RepID=UPI0003DC3C99|nr:hypothetical protein [Halorubrum sp. AJ67]CDK38162.1 uncharacterized protein domain protein [Halorubrum sp. AJ67]